MSWIFNPFWFDWGAAATALTGVAAVGAAWLVGKRQVAINQEQALHAKLSVKVALLERRVTVLDATQSYLASFMENFREPAPEIAHRFARQVPMARFLFGDEVHGQLMELRRKVHQAGILGRQLDQQFQQNPAYNQRDVDLHHELIMEIEGRYRDLDDLFGPFLELADAGQ